MNPSELEGRFNAQVAEMLQAISKTAGYPSLVGMEILSMEPGLCRCAVAVEPKHMSGVDLVHGGVISSLVDHVLSITVYPLVEPGKWVATLDFKINYTGWIKDGRIVATGRVESLRNTVAVVRVDVDNDGRRVAFAQGTLYIRDRVQEHGAGE